VVQTNGPNGGSVLSIVKSGANIFAGTSTGGVFLSTDNGTSWIAINSGLPSLDVGVLIVSPNVAGGSNLFAGLLVMVEGIT